MSGIRRTLALLLLLPCTGCLQDMWNGTRLKPLSHSPVFADGRSARPLEPGVVARGAAIVGAPTTATDGTETDTLPFPLTAAVLDRGQQRFETYCVACHGYAGYGDGIVVRRGYPPPPSYHTDRLRNAPLGHFYNVITHGYGIMYSYNDRVLPSDRWAIAAYIRALQLSQNARTVDIPPGIRRTTPGSTPVPPTSEIPDRLIGARLNGTSDHPEQGIRP